MNEHRGERNRLSVTKLLAGQGDRKPATLVSVSLKAAFHSWICSLHFLLWVFGSMIEGPSCPYIRQGKNDPHTSWPPLSPSGWPEDHVCECVCVCMCLYIYTCLSVLLEVCVCSPISDVYIMHIHLYMFQKLCVYICVHACLYTSAHKPSGAVSSGSTYMEWVTVAQRNRHFPSTY